MPSNENDCFSNLRLRVAELKDKNILYELKNEPDAVKFSNQQKKISLVEHSKWFDAALMSAKCTIFIFEIVDEKSVVGVVRFDQRFDKHVISINLAKKFRGKNLASKCLSMSITNYQKRFNTQIKICAEVLESNLKSKLLFERNGFFLIGKSGNVLSYTLKKTSTFERIF